jgi:hypothetical protein
MGPIGCPETSVTNYQYTMHNIPEEESLHLHRGGSVKLCIIFLVFSAFVSLSHVLSSIRIGVMCLRCMISGVGHLLFKSCCFKHPPTPCSCTVNGTRHCECMPRVFLHVYWSSNRMGECEDGLFWSVKMAEAYGCMPTSLLHRTSYHFRV